MNRIRFPAILPLALLAALAATATSTATALDAGADAPVPPRLSTLAGAPDPATAQARTTTQVGRYGQARVMQLQLKAGTRMPAHAAPERVLVVVLAGQGRFEFDDGPVPVRARQVLHLAPGENHGVSADTDLDLLLVRMAEH
ncbi:hypothetical protein B1992_09435 [Pseudoxanthomonas broegbernensis]|uniref:AraC-type arabinose-binding/dimerisation domain-containing protein n=1 Tax=Pseudoxanthomonas broegbernensis TaxID=83619 RepID=A0A7V8GM49_9GAMM|nr:AraC family ligand binding domain-containing protein [Pseudoxanthomonas broegbernensis]KAF1686148.1 hypothetical protein B1992_09435 [Pseudoxanthomonas broegbernensis]MBB6063851.1 quercetin dioxygenase-like cupin family protein [Pseudoxanthomonas broegbernensis]